MSKKGKGKVKKEPVVEDKEKLTEVDRAFYELTIADTKKKIKTLRTHIQNLQVSNVNIVEELRAITEDKADEAGDLERDVNEICGQIVQLKSDNATLTEEFNNDKRRTEDTISDLEAKYKAMHDQLSAQIKRLNGKLNACEEFNAIRDSWMMKFVERAEELANKEQNAKEVFRQMGTKTQFENDFLKDNLLRKLTFAGENFTGAGSIDSSNFNMRLIRENIALEKNIELLTTSNNEMDMLIEEDLELYKRNKSDIPKIEKKNSQLIRESQEKMVLIKRLSHQIQELKKEYIASLSYRGKNISFKEFQMCARFRRQKLKKTVRAVGEQITTMEREINLYDFLIKQYKLETEKIEEHLENIRSTIERSISLKAPEPSPTSSETIDKKINKYWLERNALLRVLVDLLAQHFDILDPGRRASITTMDRFDKLTRFDELFKKEAPSLSSFMDVCVAYMDSEEETEMPDTIMRALKSDAGRDLFEYETYIPAQRPLGRNYIFDVETGTSLYYSSSLDDPDRAQAEEGAAPADGEEEEGSESSSEVALASGSETKEKPAPVPPTTTAPSKTASSKLPPGTIVDVATEEEYEEDPELDEHMEEDEEYDINLFY